MLKIVIPYLEIGGERIPTPVGLSELLEPTWSLDVDRERVNKTASQYEFIHYKNEKGRWVTRCKKKVGETNENQSSRMVGITG
ncbi:hypothetical protein J1907_02895 [Lysinibacillus sphaericus]|uniref:hypothetical protein n=1 Tax=Lysinibacillus sphaericus TaxID=1421 RepID=UPI00056737D1|nr:hypothetical protein [Lysinibacillus sphaericus]QTB23079.1 hypothetical protein J1907_02895 [Lysinibacillus sphaericus]